MTSAQHDAIEAALKAHIEDDDDPGVIIIKWYAVAEFASTSRDYTSLCLAYSDSAKTWEIAGMCDWAKGKVANQWRPSRD